MRHGILHMAINKKNNWGQIYFGTVLEHILLQNLCAFYDVGDHNEMRLHGADWNDALDMAWDKGESVAFTCAYAGNLFDIAKCLRNVEKLSGVNKVEVLKELEILFADDEMLYNNPAKSRNFSKIMQESVKTVQVEIQYLYL